MNEQRQDRVEPAGAAKASHGYRNEVNWEGGSGRQPYANQGRRETPGPGAAAGVQEGNRRAQSGVNREQFESAKGTP